MSFFSTHASIRPKSIVVYSKWNGGRRFNKSPLTPPTSFNYTKGLLSYQSTKRLKKALELLIYTAKYKTVFVKSTNSYFRYKLNFVTLTLPSKQIHTDRQIVKDCLSPFLEAWQKGRKGFLYVWKAEVQDNGNLHFHITTNSFIHYEKLRKRWNKAVEKLGYVTRSSLQNPNSTDVHAVQNKSNLASYLASYMSKKDLYTKALKRYHSIFDKYHKESLNVSIQLPKNYFLHIKRKLDCRSWSASKVLLSPPPTSDYELERECKSWKMLEMLKNHAIESDYCTSYLFEEYDLKLFPEFKKRFDEYYKKLLETQSINVISETVESI